MTMMCQNVFISVNMYTIVMAVTDNVENHMKGGKWYMEVSVSSSRLSCKHKTAPEKQNFNKQRNTLSRF